MTYFKAKLAIGPRTPCANCQRPFNEHAVTGRDCDGAIYECPRPELPKALWITLADLVEKIAGRKLGPNDCSKVWDWLHEHGLDPDCRPGDSLYSQPITEADCDAALVPDDHQT